MTGKIKKGFCDIEISKLVKAEWNYKQEDRRLSEKLARNIQRHGMVENLIVRELEGGKFEVINGNHRLDVCKDVLKMAKIHVYNVGKMEESAAKRLAIATNETKFENDELKLGETLKELEEAFGKEDLLMELPYSQSELQARLELLDFDWGDNYAGAKREGEELREATNNADSQDSLSANTENSNPTAIKEEEEAVEVSNAESHTSIESNQAVTLTIDKKWESMFKEIINWLISEDPSMPCPDLISFKETVSQDLSNSGFPDLF